MSAVPTLAELEMWHGAYEDAVRSGLDPVRAVEEADAALAPKPEPEPPDWRNGYRVLVRKSPIVATAHRGDEYLPPTVIEYDEVFLSPHELRELAIEKLNMRRSESPPPGGEARANRDQRDRISSAHPHAATRCGVEGKQIGSHPSRATGDDHHV